MSQKIEGIVTRGHGNRFIVFANDQEINCQLRGKVKFQTKETTPVAVGDDVIISLMANNEGIIEEVKPRRSVLSRPAIGRATREHVLAANIDSLVVVASIKQPQLKTGLIDRFLIASQIGGLNPVIVLNKIDLGLDDEIREIISIYRNLGYEIFLTSAIESDSVEKDGLEEFRNYLSNHRSILAGHSGVGKSSILNQLMPELNIPVAKVSQSTQRGRHTTSRMELFRLPSGGFVIDSPGIKVLGLWQVAKEDIFGYYPEMAKFAGKCRFTMCSHTHEPDCAVKRALKSGNISNMRYKNYTQIYESLED